MKRNSIEEKIIRKNMIDRYISGSKADKMILCFTRKKMVYAVELNENILPMVTYAENRSNYCVLRFRPNKADQELILANALRVEILCSAAELENLKAEYNNNRGDAVEYLASVKWNGIQPTDRAKKFTECGDFSANGLEYQVKYGASTGAATITDEKTLDNLGL